MKKDAVSLKSELEKLSRDEINILCKKLRIRRYRQQKITNLIDQILENFDENTIRKALKITWWDRYHIHIYGIATIISLAISLVYFLDKEKRVIYSQEKISKNEISLSVSFKEDKLKIIDQEDFSIEFLVKVYTQENVPIDDVVITLALRGDGSELYSNNKTSLLEIMNISYDKIESIPVLTLNSPNYVGFIKGKAKEPGLFYLVIEAKSEKFGLSSRDEIEITVTPKIFFLEGDIVDLSPYTLFSLSKFRIWVAPPSEYKGEHLISPLKYLSIKGFMEETMQRYFIAPNVLELIPNYIGALGGLHLRIVSQKDEAILSDTQDAIITVGHKLWKIEVLNEHQLRFNEVNWKRMGKTIFKWKLPMESSVTEEFFIEDYNKQIKIEAGYGATGRNYGVFILTQDSGDFFFSNPLAENFSTTKATDADFYCVKNDILKVYIIFFIDWREYTLYIKELTICSH